MFSGNISNHRHYLIVLNCCFLYMQDILLMKGEGEVKLNMTVGKGEQVLKHNRMEGQEAICSQLQSLKDAWANMLMTSMSCHR